MKLNIGIDIEKISRFKLGKKALLEKIFTKKELNKIKNKGYQHIAGIYCAKESVIKACYPVAKLGFTDIEIMHDKEGRPYAMIKNPKKPKIKELRISITHTGEYAAAAAVILTK